MNSMFDVAALVAILLAIIFEYVPGAAGWFQKLPSPQHKRLVMLLLMIVVGVGAYVGSCVTPLLPSIACTESGAWVVVKAVVVAIVASQSLHPLTKRS